jgi:lipoate-protein ligase A
VLVAPQAQVWMDFWVPRGDALWDDDVVLSARWLGEAWAGALASLGVEGLQVHEGRSAATQWSGLVCFGGLGPGEVSVAGAKVVGLSQRRTREGARFLTVSILAWDPSRLARLLCLDRESEARATSHLLATATGLCEVVAGWNLGADGPSMVETVESRVAQSLP